MGESAQYIELAKVELHDWLDSKLTAFFERTTRKRAHPVALEPQILPTASSTRTKLKVDHVHEKEEEAAGVAVEEVPKPSVEERIKKNQALIKRYTELLAGRDLPAFPPAPSGGANKMLVWSNDYVILLGMEAKQRGLLKKKKKKKTKTKKQASQ